MQRVNNGCRWLLLTLLLVAGAAGQTTTTVTGTIKDLAQNVVTAGQVTFELRPGIDTTISGNARFVPTTISCSITNTGQLQSLTGGACLVTQNTAIQPAGTYYLVTLEPNFVPTSKFNWYAVGSSQDITTVVPTPATTPAYGFVDTLSNQTVAGAKTFTGTVWPMDVGNSYYLASLYAGTDCGAKINAAYAAIGTASGTVVVDPSCGQIATQVILNKNDTALYFVAGSYSFTVGDTHPDQYTVSGPIHVTANNVSVGGAGATVATLTFLASPESVAIDSLPAGCTVADGCTSNQTGLQIYGLTLNGSQASVTHPATDTDGDAVTLQAGCNQCTVHDVHVHDWVFQGIVNTGAEATSSGVSVRNNRIWNTGEYAIGLESYTRDSDVSDNQVGPLVTVPEVPAGASGIYVGSLAAPNAGGQNNDHNSIQDNSIVSPPNAGIVVQSGARWTRITGNTVSDPGTQCVNVAVTGSLPAPIGVLISGTQCYDAKSSSGGAIEAQGQNASTLLAGLNVVGNYIEDAQGAGVLIGPYVSAPVIAANVVSGAGKASGASKTDGIFLSTVTAPSVTGNAVIGAAGYGVNVYSGTTDAVVEGNALAGNTAGPYADAGTRTLLGFNKENANNLISHFTGIFGNSLQISNGNGICLDVSGDGSCSRALIADGLNRVRLDPDGVTLYAGTSATQITNANGTLRTAALDASVAYASQVPGAATLTTTAAASDSVAVNNITSSSHCAVTPTNSSAASMTGVYVSGVNSPAGDVTVAHPATAGATFSLVCTVN